MTAQKNMNLEFLRTASMQTLEEFELNRRNAAANLAQQLKTLVHAVVDELVDADLARLAREIRTADRSPDKPADPYLIADK